MPSMLDLKIIKEINVLQAAELGSESIFHHHLRGGQVSKCSETKSHGIFVYSVYLTKSSIRSNPVSDQGTKTSS